VAQIGRVTRLKWPATIITLAAELPSFELTLSDFTCPNGLRKTQSWLGPCRQTGVTSQQRNAVVIAA